MVIITISTISPPQNSLLIECAQLTSVSINDLSSTQSGGNMFQNSRQYMDIVIDAQRVADQ
ncbi:hypothetical protein GCM10028826_33920 [Mucilaginibacter boryungensis]